jgi:hypothetical protein
MSGAFLIGRRDDGKDIPVAVTNTGAVKVDIGGAEISIPGEITVSNEVEIKNDTGNPVPVSGTINTLTGLEIPDHDYIALSYTGSDLTGVTYKTGGSGGATVATLTLAYSGGNLVSVTKS